MIQSTWSKTAPYIQFFIEPEQSARIQGLAIGWYFEGANSDMIGPYRTTVECFAAFTRYAP